MNTTTKHLDIESSTAQIPLQYNESHPSDGTGTTAPEVPERVDAVEPRSARPRPPADPSRLPGYLTGLLRGAAAIDLAAGLWLLLVTAHRAPCATRLCDVATLGGHHQAAALVALLCAAVLAGAAPFTAGLTQAGTWTTVGLFTVAVLGLLSAAGVVLAAALILSVVGLLLSGVLGVMVGAIRGDLTR